MTARAALFTEIEALERVQDKIGAVDLVERLDALRRKAQTHNFPGLAAMIHGVEALLGRRQNGTGLASFLTALKDATGFDELDPAHARSWLASLGHHSGH